MDHAIADFDEAIQIDPEYVMAFNNRGVAYSDKGDAIAPSPTSMRRSGSIPISPWPSSIEVPPTATRATSTAPSPTTMRRSGSIPKTPSPCSIEVSLYRDKGDIDRAIADFSEAIRLDPNDAMAFNNRGIAYSDKGDHDRAIADLSRRSGSIPNPPSPTTTGLRYRGKGDLDRAIADFNEAIRHRSQIRQAFNNRGIAYSDKGDFDRAIADYSEAIRLDPKSSRAYNNRALAYQGQRHLDRAAADYNEAIRLNPERRLQQSGITVTVHLID